MAKPPLGEKKFYVAVVDVERDREEDVPRPCVISLSWAESEGFTERQMDTLVEHGHVGSEHADRPGNPFDVFGIGDARQLRFPLYAVVRSDGTVERAVVFGGGPFMTRGRLRHCLQQEWADAECEEAVAQVREAFKHLWEDPWHDDELLPATSRVGPPPAEE